MTLIERLRKRSEIRRSIPRSEPDRIADICEEAADELERLLKEAAHERERYETAIALSYECDRLRDVITAARKWYDSEYPPEDGHDQVYPWDHT